MRALLRPRPGRARDPMSNLILIANRKKRKRNFAGSWTFRLVRYGTTRKSAETLDQGSGPCRVTHPAFQDVFLLLHRIAIRKGGKTGKKQKKRPPPRSAFG